MAALNHAWTLKVYEKEPDSQGYMINPPRQDEVPSWVSCTWTGWELPPQVPQEA